MASLSTVTHSAFSTVQRPGYEPKYSLSTHQQEFSFTRPGSTHFAEPSLDTASVPTSNSSQYVRLLNHAIMLARRAAFPQNSDSSSTIARVSGRSIQGPGSRSSIRSESQSMHDTRIGAVGELYVWRPSLFSFFPFSSSILAIITDTLYVISLKTNILNDRRSSSFHSIAYQALPAKIGEAMCAKWLTFIPNISIFHHGVDPKQRISSTTT